MTRLRQNGRKPSLSIATSSRRHSPNPAMRDLFSLPNILALSWIIVVYWGERHVFNRSVRECSWDRWEDWVRTSTVSSPTANRMARSPAMPPRIA